jgi:NADP-dependent 3-hydroxy acid dehydrogenase YdfG
VQIDDRTRALVTGASRGIGRALASELAARGARVGLAARSREELERLADDLPGEHLALECDVADAESVRAAVAAMIDRAGGLDLVVANAGIARYGPLRTMPASDLEEMTAVNWLGTVNLVQAALPHLLDRARGHVVIVSSVAGHRSFPWAAGYGATKAAQRMFGEALRHELSGSGVSLTMVYPGEFSTAIHDHQRDRLPDWSLPAARRLDPKTLAPLVLDAVEADRRAVFHPPAIRALSMLHGLSPRLADRVVRLARGRTAAPRLD